MGKDDKIAIQDDDELVNPTHYRSSDIECIHAIEAMMTPEEFAGYLRGTVIKYLWRYDKKHRDDLELARKDLDKAQWFLHRLMHLRIKTWGVGGIDPD